ncbi:MAG: hypothetical protein AAFR93_02025 [Pseudomonadota bacterium]
MADRDAPITWAEKGAPDIWTRARDVARSILKTHHPRYLSADQDAALRANLPIK